MKSWGQEMKKRLKDKVDLPTENDVLGIPPENANQYDYYKPDPDEQDNQTEKKWLTTDGKDPKERKYLNTGDKNVVVMKPKGFNDNWII